jgi:hypothetical protein
MPDLLLHVELRPTNGQCRLWVNNCRAGRWRARLLYPRFCCNTWMCLPMGFGQEILPWPFFVPRMREVRQRHIGTAS